MSSIFMTSGCVAMILSQFLIFFYAPLESSMGIIQKIFYLHLPLALWALCSFFVVFAASAAYLFKKNSSLDNISVASAEIGVLFSSLALISGIIWAKRSWGVWWTWDPRLSTTLIMWFIYSAYLVFRSLPLPQNRLKMICAVIGVLAFLDVPLVFLSARVFRSIHPAVFANKAGGLEPEMLHTAIACIISFGLFWLGLLIFRSRQLELQEKILAEKEKELDLI